MTNRIAAVLFAVLFVCIAVFHSTASGRSQKSKAPGTVRNYSGSPLFQGYNVKWPNVPLRSRPSKTGPVETYLAKNKVLWTTGKRYNRKWIQVWYQKRLLWVHSVNLQRTKFYRTPHRTTLLKTTKKNGRIVTRLKPGRNLIRQKQKKGGWVKLRTTSGKRYSGWVIRRSVKGLHRRMATAPLGKPTRLPEKVTPPARKQATTKVASAIQQVQTPTQPVTQKSATPPACAPQRRPSSSQVSKETQRIMRLIFF